MDRRPEDMIVAAAAASKDEIAIRILLPAARLEHFIVSKQPVEPLLNVAVIDVETTGTDPLADQVIDLGYVILQVDAEGVSLMSSPCAKHWLIPAHRCQNAFPG